MSSSRVRNKVSAWVSAVVSESSGRYCAALQSGEHGRGHAAIHRLQDLPLLQIGPGPREQGNLSADFLHSLSSLPFADVGIVVAAFGLKCASEVRHGAHHCLQPMCAHLCFPSTDFRFVNERRGTMSTAPLVLLLLCHYMPCSVASCALQYGATRYTLWCCKVYLVITHVPTKHLESSAVVRGTDVSLVGLFAIVRKLPASASSVQCALCTVTHGAFKRTTDGRWVHMSCAMVAPGLRMRDVVSKTQLDLSEARGGVV